MGIVIYKLLLSLLLGIFIGLEREIHQRGEEKDGKKYPILGLRTFTLVTTLGTVGGLLFAQSQILLFLISIGVIVLTTAYYIFDSWFTKDYGITTEIALLYSFVIGVLIALNIFSLQIVIAVTVVLVLLLSRKEKVESYTRRINQNEIRSFISYAVIALVVLPLVPNHEYALRDIPYFEKTLESFRITSSLLAVHLVNPFQLWFYVALITGVDVLGYVLEKTLGQKRGWFLTSLAGGFISSTATTQSIALQSKKLTHSSYLVSATLIANMASFIQIAVLLAPLNFLLFTKALPSLVFMIAASVSLAFFFLRKSAKSEGALEKTQQTLKENQLFNIYPALKFIGLFLTVSVASKIALVFFGDLGLFITSVLGGIPGMDAVIFNLSQLSQTAISINVALIALLLGNAANLLAKGLYSLVLGSKKFALQFLLSVVMIITVSFIPLIFWLY